MKDKILPGYQGKKDVMRNLANSLMGSEMNEKMTGPSSITAPSRMMERPFKKGGPVKHKMNKTQKDLVLPKAKPLPKAKIMKASKSDHFAPGGLVNPEINTRKKTSFEEMRPSIEKLIGGKKMGGKVKCKAMGGMLGNESTMGNMGKKMSTMPIERASMKKGGSMKKAEGGSMYEKNMAGERPSKKPMHVNYESNMKGDKPIRKAMKDGGSAKKMAMGGVGKIRHKQSTKSGKQM